MLQNLGVVPHDRAEFELADGNVAEMDIGRTWVRIDGRSEIVPIIFGEEGTTALLGAVTLEIFRLGVDLVRQELIPVRGLLIASGEHRYGLMQPRV
jgi:predicted aspartyl protease